jgi:hypothetical protein
VTRWVLGRAQLPLLLPFGHLALNRLVLAGGGAHGLRSCLEAGVVSGEVLGAPVGLCIPSSLGQRSPPEIS